MQALGIQNPDVLRSSTAFAGGEFAGGTSVGPSAGPSCSSACWQAATSGDARPGCKGLGYCDKVYREFENGSKTVPVPQSPEGPLRPEYDLTQLQEREEMHALMTEMDFACPHVCGEAARMACAAAFEILEAGHPWPITGSQRSLGWIQSCV